MKNKWLVLISVALAFFLVSFDGGIIGILLPTIQTYFSAEFYQVQWITLAGFLTIVVTLAIFGRLGDSIGKKTVFVCGSIVYPLGTVLVVLARSVTMVAVFRIVQGLGLSIFLALGTAIVTEVFEEKKRGLALGVYNLLGLLGILAGPVTAGVLLERASWKTAYWVAAGLAVLCLVFSQIFLPGKKKRAKVNLDIKGSSVLFVVLAAMLLSFTYLQTRGLGSFLVIGLFLLSIASLFLFVRIERKASEPIILIQLFRNRVFSINLLLLLISMLALNGYGFLMPFYMQNVLHLSTLQMGITLAVVFGLVMAFVAPVGGALSDKIGASRVTVIGIALLFIGTIGALLLSDGSTQLAVLLHFLPIGMGIGLIVTPTTSAIMGTIPKDRLGMGASLVSITINFAQTMGIAVLGSFWSSRVNSLLGYIPEGGASTAPGPLQVGALRETFILAAVLLGIGLILNIRLLRVSRYKSADSPEST